MMLSKNQIEKIVNKTRTSGADVIKLKGATTYAPGAVIAMMADAVLTGRNRVMSVSTCPQGEYSCSAVSVGVPVVLGKNGVERIVELQLSPESKLLFEKSVAKVKNAIATLK
jgi:malate dehydrogenase